MLQLNTIDKGRRTAIYVRISTGMQKTDRQVTELKEYSASAGIHISDEDIFIDIISGFKTGEIRPKYSELKNLVEEGVYQQILFSEFSRLDRKPSNLLKSIEYYQGKGVYLYFKKQNIWVKDKSDISTQIMISVLAVMSQYEIELFVARGIDGKISALKNKGGVCGGSSTYGYLISPIDKKLVIDEKEAAVVRRIFNYFSEGKSSLQIADILNSEGIPTAYATRIPVAASKRAAKGLPEKHYCYIDPDNLVWRASTINRLVRNPIYIGHREFTFYEPDPSNPLPVEKRKGRTVMAEFSVELDDLRIVDEVLFHQVNKMMDDNKFNKNLGLRHDNLLKSLLVCGDCGSRFSVGGGFSSRRKYRCYGTVQRKYEKERICDIGAELVMAKVDGLVLHLCIRKFANYDVEKETAATLEYLNKEIEEKSRLVAEYKSKLKEENDRFSAFVRRVLKSATTDEEAQEWTRNERIEYERKIAEIQKAISRAEKKIKPLKVRKNSLSRMQKHVNILAKQELIRSDKALVKEYVQEFIKEIQLFRIASFWTLVVIHFIDGGEYWGLAKNARYKISEMNNYRDTDKETEYYTWDLNNDKHVLTYDKSRRMVIVKNDSMGIERGEYSFNDFDRLVRLKGLWTYYTIFSFCDITRNNRSAE